MAYHRQQGVNTCISRTFNSYGSRMRAHDGRAIPTFLRQALQDKPLTVFGDGSQTRSFCYVDDQIDGLVALAESDVHLPVNIGNQDEYTLLQLAETVIEVAGSRSEIIFEPLPVDDPKIRQPDISRAKDLLGWEPKVSLQDGLKRTIDEAGVERLVGPAELAQSQHARQLRPDQGCRRAVPGLIGMERPADVVLHGERLIQRPHPPLGLRCADPVAVEGLIHPVDHRPAVSLRGRVDRVVERDQDVIVSPARLGRGHQALFRMVDQPLVDDGALGAGRPAGGIEVLDDQHVAAIDLRRNAGVHPVVVLAELRYSPGDVLVQGRHRDVLPGRPLDRRPERPVRRTAVPQRTELDDALEADVVGPDADHQRIDGRPRRQVIHPIELWRLGRVERFAELAKQAVIHGRA